MYKKILCTIAAFILCTNIVFADFKNVIKDIDAISNSLNTIFISTLKDDEYTKVEDNIKFIQSQISSEKNEILKEFEKSINKERVSYLSLLSVLNYYETSILELQNYYQEKNNQSFITSVSAFNEGYSIFETVKARLNYK
ncbi:hypothetical protein SDC9_206759 [bioreactor metagenome]|uniref:Uncharacterized protein n=1 Tax=bioreactor metagenome TaxID=1076179 RepID=A0A645J5Z6_9ZZZZ|nr:hypothetical protein [Romboutsia lituseburensis]